MRIVGGEFRGRRFNPPAKNWPTRPTTDFAKEGLYNILSNRIEFEQTKFLDLFGGTGSHCYEMISRGCVDATYVDKFPGCVRFVKEIAEKLKITDHIRIIQQDVFKFVRTNSEQYDYIFAGPPYGLKNIEDIPTLVIQEGLLHEEGILILEHNPNVKFDMHPNLKETRNYGKTIFSFFSLKVKE